MPNLLPEVQMARDPDRIVVLADADVDTELMANRAVMGARDRMPKVTGHGATTLQAAYGENFFGIYFPDRRVWFLEQGIRPFTMNSLAGKTIPMWIDDPTGKERTANPKAKVRQTEDGRTQVLIFRRAALHGQRRKGYRRGPDGLMQPVQVPASYPGAPGRIAKREANQPLTTPGKRPGWIARGNVGVRWRHPGTMGRRFLNAAMADTCLGAGLEPDVAYLTDATSLYALLRS